MRKILICLFILFFISCGPSTEDQIKYILPMEFEFKISSCEESNMMYFEGIDKSGSIIQYHLPWF